MSKIKVSELVELLNLLSCGGIIESLSVKNEDEKVYTTAINEASTLMTIIEFDVNVPEFSVSEINTVLTMLNTLNRNDMVNISVNKGKLVIKREKPKKTLRISTIKEKTVKTLNKIPKIDGDVSITIDSELIRNITKDSKAVDLSEVPMLIENGMFGTIVGNLNKIENFFEENVEIEFLNENDSENIISRYAEEYISAIFRVLKGNVTIEFGTDRPLKVTKETENYTVSYIVAPIVQNEDDDEE